MLTNREKDVLNLILECKSNRQIAEELIISRDTVKAHVNHIFEKYQVHSRLELIIKLFRNHMIE